MQIILKIRMFHIVLFVFYDFYAYLCTQNDICLDICRDKDS